MVLGVPILKHFRVVSLLMKANIDGSKFFSINTF